MARLNRFDLHPYQEAMVEYMTKRSKCAMWVPMGMGKTAATLTAIKELKETFEIEKVLVVAPLRVARKVWSDEIEVWEHLHGLTVSRVVGSINRRLIALRDPADIYIVNRENTEWIVNQFASRTSSRTPSYERWPFDMVVIDESRSFQSSQSKRFKALKAVMPYINRMVQLTGTPATNGLLGLWAQLYLLDGGKRLGRTFENFKLSYFDRSPYNPHIIALKPGAEKRLYDNVGDICMTLREEDYLGLPDVIVNDIYVDMSPTDARRYREFKRKFVLEVADGKEVTALNASALWQKLCQLANGAVYVYEKEWLQIHDEKVKQLEEILRDITEKVIVVYNYRFDRERLQKMLSRADTHHARFNFRILETVKDEEDWNAGKIDILLLHPASAGHGLNLHKSGATTIIHFGLTPDLDLYLQVNARLFGGNRGHGKRGVIHRLLTRGTVDEDIAQLLSDKKLTQQKLFDATKYLIEEEKK